MLLKLTVKVLLADDEAHVRSALQLLLQEQEDFAVVGETDTVDDLACRVRDAEPDLLLLDWDLPGLRSEPIVQCLRAIRPGLLIIAMSGRPEARLSALREGVGAFICKGDAPDALLEALRTYAATNLS